MIVHLREVGLLGRLAGAALVAALLLGVGACSDYSPGSAERAPAAIGEDEPKPSTDRAAAAPEERTPPPEPRGKPTSRLLTVAEGDSVHRIARQHGVAARDIIALNGLSEPYWLLVGQRIRIPLGPAYTASHRKPPVDETWSAARNGTRATTNEIAAPAPQVQVTAAEPLAPARDEGVAESAIAAPAGTAPARAVHAAAAPAGAVQVAAVETAVPAPAQPSVTSERTDFADPLVLADNPAPMPSDAPVRREARADPAQSAPSSISALARQVDGADVPLPPTRNTFLWPAEGRVISGFGSKPGGMHNDGINIAVPVGTEVRAAQNGVVAYAGNELRGYGNLVLIRHTGGWMTAYAHNDALLVGKGDVVERGQVISRSGKSGRVSRPQAHFEIRRNGEPQDPLQLLTRK